METSDPLNNINKIDNINNIQNIDKKSFCMNCGKNGHISKKCLSPIVSIGIICIKINIDDSYPAFIKLNLHLFKDFIH